jgi:thiosulfate/3-mercaptopyruvate sulfurtransferase
MDMLVSTEWLAEHRDEVVVLDCTVFLHPADNGHGYEAESGRERWAGGHIPGAGFADLTGDLCDKASPYRFMVPSPEQFTAAMGSLGVGDDTDVVLYDDNLAMWAARVWWMLRWVGFDRAAILDGGLRAWTDEGRPLSTDQPTHPPATLTPDPRPELIADKAEVLAAIGDESTCLIDALGAAQYAGEHNTYGRPGHIPGAANSPAIGLLDRGTGRFRPLDQLAAEFPDDRTARTITYCGGGIAASSDAFTLTRLGFTDVAVYTASLQEWVDDPDAPLVTG